MRDFSKKRKVQRYLNSVIRKQKEIKVKNVFSTTTFEWDARSGYREYTVDGDVIIAFENDMCLVMSYLFVDEFKVSFRKLTDEEKMIHKDAEVKDFFNDSQDEPVELEYADITKVSIKPITGHYPKLSDNGEVEFVKAKRGTFEDVTFIMSNNKSITIGTDDVTEDDEEGITFIWSEDAKCNLYGVD